MTLYHREYGPPEGAPVLLLHGLFGSSGNWMGVVKRLQSDYRLILPDLRNHGRSPHHPQMDYVAMAGDLVTLLDSLELDSATLLGHSMGGKAAMWLALHQPERVERLVVVDIAPVTYPNRFIPIFQGLAEIPLEALPDRDSADRHLARWVPQRAVRQYLLQNLVKQQVAWQWRFNLPVLNESSGKLAAFPLGDGSSFAGEALFLYGEQSDYVQPGYREVIERHFPLARLLMVPQAGHWLYFEQPEAFCRAVKAFLR
jgi:esterase